MEHQFIKAKKFFSENLHPKFIYKNVWREQTTALLHGPRNLDKTSFAITIADDIARRGHEVLYVNASGKLGGIQCDTESLYIFNPEFESIDDKTDYADLIFEAIEQAVRTTSIRTFVIDSVTRIAALSFGRNASAAFVMKRLVALQVKCKLSLLVLADHTTKAVNNALIALSEANMLIQNDPARQRFAEPQLGPIGSPRPTFPLDIRVAPLNPATDGGIDSPKFAGPKKSEVTNSGVFHDSLR